MSGSGAAAPAVASTVAAGAATATFGDKVYQMMMERHKTLQDVKEFWRRPKDVKTHGLLISVPLKSSEWQLRREQAMYYVNSAAAVSDTYSFVEALTVEELIKAANSHAPFDELRILSHGDSKGEVVFPLTYDAGSKKDILQKNTVSISELKKHIPVRGDWTGHKEHVLIHCYNHRVADAKDLNDAFIDYMFRDSYQYTTTTADPYTYNLTRSVVDGKAGYIHTGLNPEVLQYPKVKEWLALNRQRDELADTYDGLFAGWYSGDTTAKLKCDFAMKKISEQIAALDKRVSELEK